MYRCQFCSCMIGNGKGVCPICHSTQIDPAELRDSQMWSKRTRQALRNERVPYQTKMRRASQVQKQAHAELTDYRQRLFGRKLV